MRSLNVVSLAAAVCLVLGVSAAKAGAATLTAAASSNATVQPAGPRAGANGRNFLNIESSGAGSFASFGVVDFMLPAAVAQPKAVISLSLALVEANASFSAPGTLQFFVVTNSAASIAAGDSTLKFDGNALPGGLGTQLGTAYALGNGSFNTTGNVNSGRVDSYAFDLTGPAKSFVSSIASSGGTFRLVIAPDDSAVAATFAGYSNSTYPAPTLTLQIAAIPEPSAALSMLTGIVVLGFFARRRLL